MVELCHLQDSSSDLFSTRELECRKHSVEADHWILIDTLMSVPSSDKRLSQSFCLFVKALKLVTDVNTFFRQYARGPHAVT